MRPIRRIGFPSAHSLKSVSRCRTPTNSTACESPDGWLRHFYSAEAVVGCVVEALDSAPFSAGGALDEPFVRVSGGHAPPPSYVRGFLRALRRPHRPNGDGPAVVVRPSSLSGTELTYDEATVDAGGSMVPISDHYGLRSVVTIN